MNLAAVLDGLVQFGEDDWIGLWMIAQDVEELLGIDDSNKNLETTVILVGELLKRGFRAGESPVTRDGVHFIAWPDQDPATVADLIRREWRHRATLPDWGDSPWFARPVQSAAGQCPS